VACARVSVAARDLVFWGHAFFCEDAFTEEVLGAVLNRSGVVRCFISGTTLAVDAMTSRSAGSRTRCVLSHSGYDLPALSFCIADLPLSSFVTQKASEDPARRV
jgi:hypothetical protein